MLGKLTTSFFIALIVFVIWVLLDFVWLEVAGRHWIIDEGTAIWESNPWTLFIFGWIVGLICLRLDYNGD